MSKKLSQKSSSFLRKQESSVLFWVLDSGFHRNDRKNKSPKSIVAKR